MLEAVIAAAGIATSPSTSLSSADRHRASILNRAMVEVTDIDSLGLSPDGRTLLFRTSRANVDDNRIELQLFRFDTKEGRVSAIGSGGEALIDDPGLLREAAPLWMADLRTAILTRRVDGATGLWRFDARSGDLRPLVVGASDVENPRLASDSRSILFEEGATRTAIEQAEVAERDNGVRISPSVDLAQNLFRGGRVDGRLATQRLTGYWFMRGGLLASAPRQTFRWEMAGGKVEALGDPRPKPNFVPPSLSGQANLKSKTGGLAEAFWENGNGRVLWKRAGSSTLNCKHILCTSRRVSSFAWVNEDSLLLLTFTDRHFRQTLALWDLARNHLRVLTQGEGLLSGSRKGTQPCAVARRTAFCVAAETSGPPRLIRVDLHSGATVTLFDPNAAFRASYRPKVQRLMIELPGGSSSAGVLLRPSHAEQARTPLYINYYRCEGFVRGGEGDEWPIAALLEAGMSVACLNSAPFRGQQDAVATYETGTRAVEETIRRLVVDGQIDPARVAMGGFSFGSEVTMWTAMHSSLLKAISIASAQAEPIDYWYGAVLGPDHVKIVRDVWGLGAPDETPSRWNKVSPALNAGKIKAAVLLQLPEQEARRVPQLYAALNHVGTPVEFWAYPDEAHIKIEPRHRLAVFERNFDWFTYWLNGWRDPDPAKSEQYRRWDEMKKRASSPAEGAPSP